MTYANWLILGFGVVLVLLAPTILALLMPKAFAGKAVLKRELTKHKVAWQRLPAGVIPDVIDHCADVAQAKADSGEADGFHNTFIFELQQAAETIAEALPLKPNKRGNDPVAQILNRHRA